MGLVEGLFNGLGAFFSSAMNFIPVRPLIF